MTKKLRSIIITFCVGLIAFVAYFVIDSIVKKNQEVTEEPKVTLTKLSTSNVASVKVTLADGQYYIITENADISAAGESEVAYKVTFNGIYEGLDYDESAAKQMVTYACGLLAQRDLGLADEAELAIYGLDKPQSTVTITRLDGSQVNIYVGAHSSATSSYYCKVDGSDNVYTIAAGSGGMFIRTPNEMRISQFQIAVSTDTIDTITWKYKDEKEIYIYRDLEESVFNPFTKFFIASPWKEPKPIDGDAFSELINGLNVLYINDHITPKVDGTEVNLADYGLDNPWGYYKLTGKDGAVQEFSFGDYSDGETEYYCYMLDHATNHIYTVARSKVEFIEKYKAIDVTSPYIINAISDNIQLITAEYNGKTSILEVERDYLSEEEKKELEDAGEDVVDFTTSKKLEGMEYDAYNLGILYQKALIVVHKEYKNHEHEEEPMLKMTFKPFDADYKAVEIVYYRLKDNENFCAAYVNGNCDFLVATKSVQGYINAIADVKAGITPR